MCACVCVFVCAGYIYDQSLAKTRKEKKKRNDEEFLEEDDDDDDGDLDTPDR